jgi:probable F420-dependent oxidoreductase
MEISLRLPTHRVDKPQLISGRGIGAMARAAESAGFGGVWVTDHPVPPDDWVANGGHRAMDPFVVLSVAAAVTSVVQLQTILLVAPYRHPILVAKSLACLDTVSDGRLVVGVATGYLESEFEALGVPFAERNERADEMLRALPAAWSGNSLNLAADRFRVVQSAILPRPVQRPGPKIWVGGNSRRALRRVVEFGTGWVPIFVPADGAARVRTRPLSSIEELARRIKELRAMLDAAGRDPTIDVVCYPPVLEQYPTALPDPAAVTDQLEQLSSLGVTTSLISVPGQDLDEVLFAVNWWGEHILGRTKGGGGEQRHPT